MNLAQLIVDTKCVEVEFPGLPGFKVKLSAVSRELSKKITKEAQVTKIDPKLRMPVTELDQDIFLEKFAAAAIKGWSGFKMKYLSQLALVDESAIEDMEAEIDYNLDNVVHLIKNSQAFDAWINENVFNLEIFRSREK